MLRNVGQNESMAPLSKVTLGMLQFVKSLGFEVTTDPDDLSVMLVSKYLKN